MSWYIEAGPQHDVVLSSRIRLARNFRDLPFPAKASMEDGKKVRERAKSLFQDMLFVDIPEIPAIDRQALVERHLISPELAAGKNSPAVFISRDEGLSIMVNEEDHLRIQSIQAGLRLDIALRNAVAVDEFTGSRSEYAFRPDYGYLTGCPTNLGTGMRASVMMHLPAMAKTGVMDKTIEACSKLGMTVRGLYGEHSEASGFIFQISNQASLGQSEEDIVSNVNAVVMQIAESERKLRNGLLKKDETRFLDTVYRALAVFSNARIMTSEECLKLISEIRLGVSLGLLKEISVETLNELMLATRPAMMQKNAGRPLDAAERDIQRAELIRTKLGRRG